jgi:hypothetical protein
MVKQCLLASAGPEREKSLTNNDLLQGIVNKRGIGFTLDFESGANMNPGMILVQTN